MKSVRLAKFYLNLFKKKEKKKERKSSCVDRKMQVNMLTDKMETCGCIDRKGEVNVFLGQGR